MQQARIVVDCNYYLPKWGVDQCLQWEQDEADDGANSSCWHFLDADTGWVGCSRLD
jgi:hypothetical protein